MEERRSKAVNLVYAQMHRDCITHKIDDSKLSIWFGKQLLGSVVLSQIYIQYEPREYKHTDLFNELLEKLGIPRGSRVIFRNYPTTFAITVSNNTCSLAVHDYAIPISYRLCISIIVDCIVRYPKIPIKQN
jgi:hypothetical protein